MSATQTNFQKLIQKIKSERPKIKERTLESLAWYNRMVEKEFGKKGESPLEIYETRTKKLPSFPGQLITFKYIPKEKNALPFYDQFPLVLTLGIDGNSILGLNFHYIKPLHRVMFMSELYKYLGKRVGEPIIRVDYKTLMNRQQLAYYRPCIRKYLFKNVSQKISTISFEDWELALFLPTQKFVSHVGESTSTDKIWSASWDLIKKG